MGIKPGLSRTGAVVSQSRETRWKLLHLFYTLQVTYTIVLFNKANKQSSINLLIDDFAFFKGIWRKILIHQSGPYQERKNTIEFPTFFVSIIEFGLIANYLH